MRKSFSTTKLNKTNQTKPNQNILHVSLSIQQPDMKKLLNNKTKHFTCEFKHSAARQEKAYQQQNKTKQNKTFYMWV